LIKCAVGPLGTAISFASKPIGWAASRASTAPGLGAAVGGSIGGGAGVIPGAGAGYLLAHHPGLLAGLALGVPAAVGGTAGYLAAKSNSDPLALASANADELVSEYNRLANQEMRRQTALKRQKAIDHGRAPVG
jgi:hypothetical protein